MKRENIPDPGPPSKTLIDVADELTSLSQYPVLDAGCGFGRNAVALASLGLSVVCIDRNLDRLKSFSRSARLHLVHADLKHSQWPFSQNCFAAIICVHFLDTYLFDAFRYSLIPSGHLYIETFGGHGGNYLDLPKAGQLRDLLSRHFNLAFYRERQVGPADSGAVSVKLFGKTKP